jgi:hypothetical protein
MMKSKESLEWCSEAIMNNEKIPTLAAGYQASGHAVINHRLPDTRADTRV